MDIAFQTPSGNGGVVILPSPASFKERKYSEAMFALELEKTPPIIIFGKECKQNRDMAFFSDEVKDGYKYNKLSQKAKPLSESKELTEILTETNEIFGTSCNGILVNRYNDGKDYIGAHQDKNVDDIVGLVFGATRKFRIRDLDNKLIKDIEIPAYTYYCMYGDFNKLFKHEIPKQLKVKEARISLTFREH